MTQHHADLTVAAVTPVAPPVLSDSLGCLSSKLHRDQQLSGGGITFYRKRSDDDQIGHVATPATDRGFLVGVSKSGGHRRRIIHEHHATTHEFEPDSIYVRSFADAYRADMKGRFDFLLLEISHAALGLALDEAGNSRSASLVRTTGRQDPALSHLVSALLPALDRPREASTLFVDQLATAILTYLAVNYGGAPAAASASAHTAHRAKHGTTHRALSRVHEARAKDMLLAHIDGQISIGEVAEACHLSRSYFTLAFRQTTGQTPHQWLLAQRVERARALLQASRMPLAEVAAACGFADQSHFTRVFSQTVGVPPGQWRRHA